MPGVRCRGIGLEVARGIANSAMMESNVTDGEKGKRKKPKSWTGESLCSDSTGTRSWQGTWNRLRGCDRVRRAGAHVPCTSNGDVSTKGQNRLFGKQAFFSR